jgi:hypothetical protein
MASFIAQSVCRKEDRQRNNNNRLADVEDRSYKKSRAQLHLARACFTRDRDWWLE